LSNGELEEMRKTLKNKSFIYEQFLWVLAIVAKEHLHLFVTPERTELLLVLGNHPDWRLLCPEIPLVISKETAK
jgi:hypothetical protein